MYFVCELTANVRQQPKKTEYLRYFQKTYFGIVGMYKEIAEIALIKSRNLFSNKQRGYW